MFPGSCSTAFLANPSLAKPAEIMAMKNISASRPPRMASCTKALDVSPHIISPSGLEAAPRPPIGEMSNQLINEHGAVVSGIPATNQLVNHDTRGFHDLFRATRRITNPHESAASTRGPGHRQTARIPAT